MGTAGEGFATCVIYPVFYAKVKLAKKANGIASLYKGLQQEVFASAASR
jgi:hypothetical protein